MKKIKSENIESIKLSFKNGKLSTSYINIELNDNFGRASYGDTFFVNGKEMEINLDDAQSCEYLEVIEDISICENLVTDIINMLNDNF